VNPGVLRFGTRTSALARWQTAWVARRLAQRLPALRYEIVPISTAGDRDTATPLPVIGGKGVFTAELEHALLSGTIDVAVHSLKDVPVEILPELALVVAGPRADARDVLIARNDVTLASLPFGATVGTCSTRRTAQLLAARPDLAIAPLRGNVDTRVAKALAGEYDAILIAAAGVDRLGLLDAVRERLAIETIMPAPGQGALAVEHRRDDAHVRTLLEDALRDADLTAAVTAERAFLAGLGGGCDAPVAAYAAARQGVMVLNGLVASTDGRMVVRVQRIGAAREAQAIGADLARVALEQGAVELIA
jgi:hydroxymethylbilane synthase